MNKAGYIFGCILSVCLFISCDPGRLYEENKTIDENAWYYKNKMFFDVQIKDTTKIYNVLVNVRVSSEYKYSNIFMLVNAINPDKRSDERRIEIKLADETGRWLGSGLGDIYDYQFPAIRKVKFPKSGFYRFELEQNMRDDTLMYVKSAGIRVEESKEQ